MRITIAGMGMGGGGTMTAEVGETVKTAGLVIGASRLLDSLPKDCIAKRCKGVIASEIAKTIKENSNIDEICVVMSGDSGFYSGAKKLLPLLEDFDVTVLPGISTVQYMAARIGRPWQDTRLVTAHGTVCNVTGYVLMGGDTFFLTGGAVTVQSLLETLDSAGIPGITVMVGENLSYENERIVKGTPKQLLKENFSALAAVWVHYEKPEIPHKFVTGGIPDELFIRGEVPMTKQEVRTAALAKLGISRNDILYDIGAGTGSVSVEMALTSPMAQVFAVEMNPDACRLIEQNRIRFGVYNLTLIEGGAPEALEALPPPEAVFIGGSKHNMRGILELVKVKNPAVRVVITATALETLADAMDSLKELSFADVSVTQMSVSRTKNISGYSMLAAQNPIFIISGRGTV